MGFEEVKYKFPHENDEDEIEIEGTGAVEVDLSGKKTAEEYAKEQEVAVEAEDDLDIEVVDDTPEEDQGREVSEPPEDVTEEEWTAGKKATEDANGNTVDALYPSDSTWSAKHTEPVMQGIDQSKLVPLLTGALQEAITKIETLETKVAALEAG